MEACRFHQDEDRFLSTSLSPSYYDTFKFPRLCQLYYDLSLQENGCTPYLNAKETTGSPKVSTAEGLGVDDGEIVGVGGSGGKSLHCWIRLDRPRCRSLER